MSRLYCPKCRQFSNEHHVQNPVTNNFHCVACGTKLIDWDAIDNFVASWEIQGC